MSDVYTPFGCLTRLLLLIVLLMVLGGTQYVHAAERPPLHVHHTHHVQHGRFVPRHGGHGVTLEIGRPIWALVTGYSWGCGATQATASGQWPYVGGTAAYTPEFPFGTIVRIPGLWTVRVNDTGGAVGPDHFDVFFSSCFAAVEWGSRHEQVWVLR